MKKKPKDPPKIADVNSMEAVGSNNAHPADTPKSAPDTIILALNKYPILFIFATD